MFASAAPWLSRPTRLNPSPAVGQAWRHGRVRDMARQATLMLAACSMVALLLGCSQPPPPAEPVRAVKLLTVGVDALQAQHDYAAEVRARVESRLGFRVAGKLLRRHVEVGQRVRAGQLLAEIDPQDYQLAADAARAAVAAAQTNRDLAAADFRRFAALKEQNFISGAELERRDTALKAAQAQLDQAQAQLAAQGNQAAYARLVADAAGVVTALDAEVGQVVTAGQPVVRLAVDGERDVVFSVPEHQLARWRVGDAVSVRLLGRAEPLPARLREIGASADPATRTYQLKAALPAAAPAALGMTATVMPVAGRGAAPVAMRLPTSALRQEGGATAVWLFDPATSTVRSQTVQVATADGNEAVIGAGLQPGQQVVVAGVHVLQPGQKVTVWQPRVAASN